MTHKPSNVAAAAKLFSSVYIIGTTSFDESFLFCITTVSPLGLKEVRIFRYIHNDSTMLIVKLKYKVYTSC